MAKWVNEIKYYKNSIQNSLFADNVAGERGGAIYGFRTSSSDKTHCAKAVKCTFSDNKAPKGKDIYGGTKRGSVFKNTKINIKSVVVRKSAKKLILLATLKKGSAALKSKQVTFRFNGNAFKAKTNSKGIAKISLTRAVLKRLVVGKKVSYSARFKSFTSKRIALVLR